MEDFVSFELTQRLKEKGFTIPTRSIFGMYNEIGVFHTLTTSADYDVCDSGFECRCFYDYDDFDERDFIAPTISQVLKWIREEQGIHVCIMLGEFSDWVYEVSRIYGNVFCEAEDDFKSYEQAALAGIEYVLDNLDNLI